MKNKKRKNSLFCYKGINLALPISTAALFSVLSILSIVFSEGVYRFHFLLMPRGAFPMPILIITFITSIGLIGGGAGMFIIDRNYRKCKEKVAAVLSASVLSVIMNIWYNVLFSSFAFFGAFVFSIITVITTCFVVLIALKFFKNSLILFIPPMLFNLYCLWLSFSLLLIN